MKPTPLLDLWTPPAGAGDPMAVLATTFTLEPDFFERDCLSRFLAVSSVDEDSGTVSDIVARIELEEKLAGTRVTVIADRNTRADRSSLRWDLLHAHVPGGLLHAKVAVLLWSNATRVIIGSANLTSAGYRRQIELAMAADLGPRCALPATVLNGLADELASYLDLIPGHGHIHPAAQRAESTIGFLRRRVAEMAPPLKRRAKLTAALAPSGPGRSPLDTLTLAWDGPQPRRATELSPFWDSDDVIVVERVRQLLRGQGARSHVVASVLTASGEVPVPPLIRAQVDGTYELVRDDQELRTLHAKCLVLESDRWIASLIGSSNHTRAGMGLKGDASHREINVWLGADIHSEEGEWLNSLVQLARRVPTEAASAQATGADETEDTPPSLPLGFELCRLQRVNEHASSWQLLLQLGPPMLPAVWTVCTPSGWPVLASRDWEAQGRPSVPVVGLTGSDVPAYLNVKWDGSTATWTVVADDPLSLPPSPEVGSLNVRQLLSALAGGKSITAAVQEEVLRKLNPPVTQDLELDPHRRFADRGSLLRRGRALSAALAQLQLRLERPVLATDALEAGLAGPLAPRHLAMKTAEAARRGDQTPAEALFTVAELLLTVARVDWTKACEPLTAPDRPRAMEAVMRTVEHLNCASLDIGSEPTLMAAYAQRAYDEAQRCLST